MPSMRCVIVKPPPMLMAEAITAVAASICSHVNSFVNFDMNSCSSVDHVIA